MRVTYRYNQSIEDWKQSAYTLCKKGHCLSATRSYAVKKSDGSECVVSLNCLELLISAFFRTRFIRESLHDKNAVVFKLIELNPAAEKTRNVSQGIQPIRDDFTVDVNKSLSDEDHLRICTLGINPNKIDLDPSQIAALEEKIDSAKSANKNTLKLALDSLNPESMLSFLRLCVTEGTIEAFENRNQDWTVYLNNNGFPEDKVRLVTKEKLLKVDQWMSVFKEPSLEIFNEEDRETAASMMAFIKGQIYRDAEYKFILEMDVSRVRRLISANDWLDVLKSDQLTPQHARILDQLVKNDTIHAWSYISCRGSVVPPVVRCTDEDKNTDSSGDRLVPYGNLMNERPEALRAPWMTKKFILAREEWLEGGSVDNLKTEDLIGLNEKQKEAAQEIVTKINQRRDKEEKPASLHCNANIPVLQHLKDKKIIWDFEPIEGSNMAWVDAF